MNKKCDHSKATPAGIIDCVSPSGKCLECGAQVRQPMYGKSPALKAFEDLAEARRTANPFYNNHVFSQEDIKRVTLKLNLLERISLFFKPTFCQVSEGYAWKYKIGKGGVYYLLKYEKIFKDTEIMRTK